MEARQVKTRHLVEAVHGVPGSFNGLEKSGTLTRAQAQEAAMTAVKTLRYDEKEYFWINDRHPTMVMHPYKPELAMREWTCPECGTDRDVNAAITLKNRIPQCQSGLSRREWRAFF